MRFNPTVLGRSALLLAAVLTVGACEKQVREAKNEQAETSSKPAAVADASRAPGDQPTAATAARAPDSKPAADTQPALTLLMIDGLSVQFPPTKLLLGSPGAGRDSVVAAELYSDLPKTALRNYAGNEMYLELKLRDGTGPQKVEGATWRFKAERSQKADSPNGIFLNGQSTHLQPFDVQVRLQRRANGQLVAQLMGQFRAFEDGTPESLAPFVGVSGELPVEIVQKR